jgi:hypothetical protein
MLLGISIVDFFNSSFSITMEQIIVLCLACMIFFSDEFNSLTLGKLLSISKKVESNQKTVEEVRDENFKIRNLLMNQMTYQKMDTKSEQNIAIRADFARDMYQVEPIVDTQTHQTNEVVGELETDKDTQAKKILQVQDWRVLQQHAIQKYLEENDFSQDNVQYRIKFSEGVEELNPISKKEIIYDAHYDSVGKEIFFEVRNLHHIEPEIFDHLYVMLSQIKGYREAKSIVAYMVLIIIMIEDGSEESDEIKYKGNLLEEIRQDFIPAMGNSLLKINVFKFPFDEIEGIIGNRKD